MNELEKLRYCLSTYNYWNPETLDINQYQEAVNYLERVAEKYGFNSIDDITVEAVEEAIR